MPNAKTISKRPRKERDVDRVPRLLCPKLDAIEPSPETQARLDALCELTPDEMEANEKCPCCGGYGLPKSDFNCTRLCVVCVAALEDIHRTQQDAILQSRMHFMLYRMRFFREFLLNPNRNRMLKKTA